MDFMDCIPFIIKKKKKMKKKKKRKKKERAACTDFVSSQIRTLVRIIGIEAGYENWIRVPRNTPLIFILDHKSIKAQDDAY